MNNDRLIDGQRLTDNQRLMDDKRLSSQYGSRLLQHQQQQRLTALGVHFGTPHCSISSPGYSPSSPLTHNSSAAPHLGGGGRYYDASCPHRSRTSERVSMFDGHSGGGAGQLSSPLSRSDGGGGEEGGGRGSVGRDTPQRNNNNNHNNIPDIVLTGL